MSPARRLPAGGPGHPARVDGGRYVGASGGCASQGGAREAGRVIAARDGARSDLPS